MCGIVGYLNFRNGFAPSEDVMRAMLAAIRHRGPDQFGIYLDDFAALGNARLSIIDLDHGQQPMTTADRRYWIVYNGEIFNHRELREELESNGIIVQTQCDTEIFLKLFEKEGPQCLHRLNGQFAVAVWDAREKKLFLARDRLGIRPLYYSFYDNTFVFGSEIKAIASFPGLKLSWDAAALDQIFTGWSCLAPLSPFSEIKQLRPGSYAWLHENGIQEKVYWEPQFDIQDSEFKTDSETDLIEALHDLLLDSVQLRLQADVPVGAYLSGGLDSSLIASLVKENAKGRFDTFSIAFSDTNFDESEHQRRMASLLDTEHQVITVTHEEIRDIFPEVVWHCENPILRTAPAPMFLLSRLVNRSHYKVVLTGEGADEFFAGYDIFKEAKIRAFWAKEPESERRPKLLQRIYPDLQNLARLGPKYLANFFGHGLTDTAIDSYSHSIRWMNTRRAKRFFSRELSEAVEKRSADLASEAELPAAFKHWDILSKAQCLEISTFLSSYLLSSQGDRVGMGNSVEGRYPFLDYRVSEFCSKLPAKFRMRGLRDKYLLRKLGKEILPKDIWDRPKKPYRAPIHRSFFSSERETYVDHILSEGSLEKSGLFNPKAVSMLTGKIKRGLPVGEIDDMALTGLISTQLLHEQYVDGFTAPEPLGAKDDVLICDSRRKVSQN